MPHSSLGFHTITLSLPLFIQKALQLIKDCKEYSRKFHNIQIYSDKNGNEIIKFYPKDKGINWLLQYNVWLDGASTFVDILKVTINPKILSGIYDYINAATYNDMDVAIANFNLISKQISPILGSFDNYQITRIDYCINFDLDELVPGCNHELIMNLIKRADVPPQYKEWKYYDAAAHRMKSPPGSFYLTNQSVHINCYSKYMKLQEQSFKSVERGYSPISQSDLDTAKNIIRFEVQCKYHKTYTLSELAKKSGNKECNKYKSLLTNDICNDVIFYYFKKTIKSGDWYSFRDAVRKIERLEFNCQKERRLIDALSFIAQCRSLAKAKESFKDDELKIFKKTITDLSGLGINPVTIPRDWGIRHIPNLLNAYFDKVQEETDLKEMNCFDAECYRKYLQKRREKEVIFSIPPSISQNRIPTKDIETISNFV